MATIIPVQHPAEQYSPDGASRGSPRWTQSPLLRPNLGIPDGVGGQSTVLRSQSDFLGTHPRVQATVTGTVGGTEASGHAMSVTFTNAAFPGGSIVVAYTSVTADTTATELGDHLALTINQNASCQAFGISASSVAGAMVFYQQGPVGNYTTASFASAGSETITFGNSGVMAGGSGPVIAWKGFSITLGGQLFVFQAGSAKLIDVTLLNVLVKEGHPVV